MAKLNETFAMFTFHLFCHCVFPVWLAQTTVPAFERGN